MTNTSYFTIVMTKDDYNNEEVHFCKDCLSLNIRYIKGIIDSDYCDSCGSTDIGTIHINDWKNLYKNTYGEDFVKHKN